MRRLESLRETPAPVAEEEEPGAYDAGGPSRVWEREVRGELGVEEGAEERPGPGTGTGGWTEEAEGTAA